MTSGDLLHESRMPKTDCHGKGMLRPSFNKWIDNGLIWWWWWWWKRTLIVYISLGVSVSIRYYVVSCKKLRAVILSSHKFFANFPNQFHCNDSEKLQHYTPLSLKIEKGLNKLFETSLNGPWTEDNLPQLTPSSIIFEKTRTKFTDLDTQIF